MPETQSPGPVPREALAYFRGKDLRPGFDHRDVWGDEHAYAFTVAKATKLDILEDIRGGLDEALAEGKTFRDFSREVKPTLQRKGWWGIKEETDPVTGEARRVQLGSPRRLKTIYRSNMRAARSAGQWERIQRTKESRPFLVYLLGPSREHREEHVELQGLTLRVDHPIWGEIYPPNGYGCKCHVRQVSRDEVDRMREEGVEDSTAPQEIDPESGQPTGRRRRRKVPMQQRVPDLPRRRFVNKRTGEQITVLQGVHPAWANNTGQARVRVLREALAQRVSSADQTLARNATASVVNSPVFDKFTEQVRANAGGLKRGTRPAVDRVGELPVGVLPRNFQREIGSEIQAIRLSGQDMAKQLERHGDLTRADYVALQDVLDRGVVLRQRDNRLVFFLEDGDRIRQAVVKATGKRDKVFLNSYHFADRKAMRRAIRRAQEGGRVVRGTQQ